MRALHRSMLVLTLLLLISEVAISRICKSLINMVDGFHTLFILMHMVLPLSQTTSASRAKEASHRSLSSSRVSPPSPPLASSSLSTTSSTPPSPSLTLDPSESSVKSLSCIQTTTCRPSSSFSSPSLHPLTPDPTPVPTTPSQASSVQLSPSTSHGTSPGDTRSPQTPLCGLSYTHMRIQTVGRLVSALLLASLCVSICLEIITHILQPHPIQRPLLAVLVGALSLLHNLLVLGLSWGQLQGCRTEAFWEVETRSHLEVIEEVKGKEQTKDHTEQGCVVDDVGRAASAVDGSFHNGTLVLCNPGTSSVLDPYSDSQAQNQKPPPPGVLWHTEVPQGLSPGPCYKAQTCVESEGFSLDNQDSEVPNSITDTEGCNQNASKPSQVFKSDQCIERALPRAQWPDCLPLVISAIQALSSSILALTNGLVLLLVIPDYLHRSWSCWLLVYLDPGFSLLAVIVLLAIALPQVYRYGLLLLQATPPHVCVSDLKQRIVSVPGVQAVHDLHIWQLTDTCTVASVHVHCHAGFQVHRCGDLTSRITMVLRSVGVSCCTVQPEFLSSPSAINSSLDNKNSSPPIVHREVSSLPPLLTCSLACGKDCARKMCCSPPVEETGKPMAPSAGETEEDPQALVIENTFL